MDFLRRMARQALGAAGFALVRTGQSSVPSDADPRDVETMRVVAPYTMTSPQRVLALCEAVRYIVAAGIAGDVVECGVWRGGSTMAAAQTLLHLGDRSRSLYLYDTFEGMSAPDEHDVDTAGTRAIDALAGEQKSEESRLWCIADKETVGNAVFSTGYPSSQVHLVQGKVEDTIPGVIPERIALLRLDTDWFASTRHEMEHLFPRLVVGGVLIVDDYGHWKGAREAVDQYLAFARTTLLLSRIDYTGRIAVKVAV